jgi:flavin reductase (DIM6/NTAB) family NADH-FMN oxidoreductase RutF
MFYRPSEGHGLPRDPWMMCVIPRPIGWISTLSAAGELNLAPYSFFNAVAEDPPMVMFATNGAHSHGEKDTARNVRATREFVCSMASSELRTEVKISSVPLKPGDNEFARAQLETEVSNLVKPPRVKGSPIQLECTFVAAIDLPRGASGDRNLLTIGEVVGVHIDDAVMRDGLVDVTRLRPLARLGYDQFTEVSHAFSVLLPPSLRDRSHGAVGERQGS